VTWALARQGFFDDPSMPVRSPSYLLELPYDGPAKPGITIRHIDLFRCSGPEDLEVLGLLTAAQLKAGRDPHIFLPSNEIALIEWPESVGLRFMPENRLDIHFSMAQQEEHLVNGIDGHPEEDEDEDEDEEKRQLCLRGFGTWELRLLQVAKEWSKVEKRL
jgi:tRNA A37 threonylcarbamoyladenosine biosynthesis protein TsaE